MNETDQRSAITALLSELGVTVAAEFVPFSQTGKKAAKLDDYSLNWTVTIQKDGREVLKSPYSAGIGYCPSYRQTWNGSRSVDEADAIKAECRTGKTSRGKAIPFDAVTALHCLVSDADAIDYPTFEGWASDMGYDHDSRSAEKTYRTCLEIGLKLRAGLGEDGLTKLREAFQNF